MNKFEKGKWYKCNTALSDRIYKYEKRESGRYGIEEHYTERIVGKIHEFKTDYLSNDEWSKSAKEVNLSEIQQFLPAGHPDKTPAFKFEIGQKVKSNGNGKEYCTKVFTNPVNSDNYDNREFIIKEKSNSERDGKNIYKVQFVDNNYNHGNWITEEGLELVKEKGLKLEVGKYYKSTYSGHNWYWQLKELREKSFYVLGYRQDEGQWTTSGIGGAWQLSDNKDACEISEQEAKNQPIMKEEDLTGRYLKALEKEPQCILIQKGEFVQIISSNLCTSSNSRNWGWSSDCIGTVWELMPKDFSPKQEEEFKIGDWVVANNKAGSNGLSKQDEVYQLLDNTTSTSISGRLHSNYDFIVKDHNKNCGTEYKRILRTDIVRKALLSEIPNSKETLLEEAKRRFPIGTKFKDTYSSSQIEYVVNNYYHDKDDLCIWSELEGEGGGTIYNSGKWAEIVQEFPKTSKITTGNTTSYWESIEDSFIYNKPLTTNEVYVPHGTKPKLIPIKTRNQPKVVESKQKRTKLTILTPKRISLNN